VQRLVVLGDVLELRHGPIREALGAAEPVLRALGRALGDGEVVIVPGNHDHRLLAPWLERRSMARAPVSLDLESPVDWRGGEALAHLAAWLAPARVRAAYPGVWLRDDVYAMHGHYGDRHTTVPTFERLGAGAMVRVIGQRQRAPQRAEDYEAVLAPLYGWVDRLAEHRRPGGAPDRSLAPSSHLWSTLGGDGRPRGVRRRALRAGVTVAIAGLDRAGLGPLHGDLSGVELRRAGLAACGQVVQSLGIEARHIVFGHTHRAGPLAGDDPREWTIAGDKRMLNTGCWVHEPAYLGRSPHTSPYRAGFAALLDDGGSPRLVNLLDGLGAR
jgi:hypothetical protein